MSKKRAKIILGVPLVAGIIILMILFIVIATDKKVIELSVPPEDIVIVEYGESYRSPDVTAVYHGSRVNTKKVKLQVEKTGNVDTSKIGTYKETYTASYKDVTATATRTVRVKDTLKPVIELISNPEHFTSPLDAYEEEGYRATDNYDGDLTEKVVRTEKDGVVTYTVRDSSGNEGTAIRNIVYKDVVSPQIELTGGRIQMIEVGTTYEEPGYVATDDVDGDLTAKVTVEGNVDVSKEGKYTKTYLVMDSYENTAKETRTIYVFKKQEPVQTIDPGDKVVYLTFDDGPGKHTARLLDILDKYGVKATFFVTNQYPEYKKLIAEEHRRGHTVAVHSYTHDYATIYKSQEAFFEDMQKMADVCKQQTGEEPKILRFPGGSSNTTSKKYCQGIMTELSQNVGKLGYLYCDWNVASGDAGEVDTAEEVAQNVINGIKKSSRAIVLQHDIKGFSVDAVEEIIAWGLANGYKFLPLVESSPMSHHGINN